MHGHGLAPCKVGRSQTSLQSVNSRSHADKRQSGNERDIYKCRVPADLEYMGANAHPQVFQSVARTS